DHSGLRQDLLPAGAPIDHRQCFRASFLAEDDVDVLELDSDIHLPVSRSMRAMRSRMIAKMTIARPASTPSGILTELSARTTGRPRPSAPVRAAITTIDNDSMMHWVSPAMIDGSAAGNSTFQSSWLRVAPKALPA